MTARLKNLPGGLRVQDPARILVTGLLFLSTIGYASCPLPAAAADHAAAGSSTM
jgi:hypothetical protein